MVEIPVVVLVSGGVRVLGKMIVDEVVCTFSVVGIEGLVMLSDEVVSVLGVGLDGKVSDEDDVVIYPANKNNNVLMVILFIFYLPSVLG